MTHLHLIKDTLSRFCWRTNETWLAYKTAKHNLGGWIEEELLSEYAQESNIQSAGKTVIYISKDCSFNPGLCDKLRGILTTYKFCKDHNLAFKIHWDFPFHLHNYLQPSKYDWQISSKQVLMNNNSLPIVIESSRVPYFPSFIDRSILRRRILNTNYEQYHIFSNAPGRPKSFPALFDELFKMSPSLVKEVSHYKESLGDNYISISLRFMELLGDFQDQEGLSQPLSVEQQKSLMHRCYDKVIELLSLQPAGAKAFLATDSKTFLDFASKHPDIVIVPGAPSHSRYHASDDSVMKTFVDLMLIKGAQTKYLLRTDAMYDSGFPRFASWCSNQNFKLIEF